MKKLLLLLCILLISTTSFSQKMEFEDYNPPSTLKVEETIIKKSKFPFIDVHNHQWDMPNQDLAKLTAQMDALNMAVMVNLSGRRGGSDVFFKGVMNNVRTNAPKRFIIFTNISLDGIDDEDWTVRTVAQLESDVKAGANGLKIYKSQTMDAKDNSGNRIKISDPRIGPVFEKCGELGIPVLIHSADPKPFWDAHDNKNERWLELKLRSRRKRDSKVTGSWETIIAEQHSIFRKHKSTKFINAHLGWFANDLSTLAKLMDEMPNMYTEIGAVIAELGRQPRNAKKFLTKYQDRVMFGKDYWKPEEYYTYFRVLESNDEYFPYYKRYHAFWKMYGLDLSDEVLKKIYYKNALKVIPNIDKSLFPN
ncbi:amidohydrolase family protein [Spongiivirga citrea]|uniref:Amidohydrolase family protein n=1 Tax=Spongiivirga citrea TaxID=1481457 RepID=A0A6M0CL29_9FLAO|nr:amidohydrolase family protein [Spongiivirga citrea]NER18591.1 amidohydrolase family protein [Spongiivirga citrea]